MKYLSVEQIRESLRYLRPHHPILAVTFLVMKQTNAPVGQKARFKLDALNDEFLKRHYRAHPKSAYFYRVMRKGTGDKDWNLPGYAAKGLQSVNTRGFRDAFLHDKDDDTWGWSKNYVEVLKEALPKGQKLPLFHLAAWIHRDEPMPDATSRRDIVQRFARQFRITREEFDALFTTTIESNLSEEDAFSGSRAAWYEVLRDTEQPPDVPPERGGLLTYLDVEGVGPSEHLSLEPGPRLNIITGDNGLGKTFLLDLAWWALTGNWAGMEAAPKDPATSAASIKYTVGVSDRSKPQQAKWNAGLGEWNSRREATAISGLVFYARVDGSFSVWDPINRAARETPDRRETAALTFSREEVWNGTDQIEGLLRDWVKWQESPKKYPFDTFESVLRRVAPPDMGELSIGPPTRILGQRREIPTLVHPYGTVPLLYESAGIKRIATLAYLIVWAWEEHKIRARQLSRPEERQMVVIIDEVEAHLHPRWQRVILPALLGISKDLSEELQVQMVVATHSPLVLASAEPVFNPDTDRLFHIEMSKSGAIRLGQLPFELHGSSDSWLSSEVFDVNFPGSSQRAEAMQRALAIQKKRSPTKAEVQAASDELRRHLPAEDPFWARWVFFAEEHGVTL